MRKLFLLLSALVLSLMANAKVIHITNSSSHVLRDSLAQAASGDIIEMAAGTYAEKDNWLAIDDKAVTVRAAEGAEVIIKPQFSVRVKAGATNQIGKAEFIGVKFDCSALESHQLFVPSDNQANQSVILKNCELYDWSHNEALIQSTSSRKLDVIDIDNCYFHGFEKSIVFVENASLVSLSITNSTFANVAGNTESYDAAPIDVRAASGSVLVDHCTFYNVNSKSLSYGTVTVKTITDPVVSNCIFMLTASADMCATNLKAGGDVKNCLTFNYDNWQPCGHYSTATLTDCFKADPVFKDAANSDYTLRMGSPARGAGLAGGNMGAPCWSAVPEPVETDFASALTLEAADAIHNEYFTLNADHYLKANNPDPASVYGIATWQIHATKEVAVQVTLNNNSASLYGHTYKVEIFDANDEKKGEVAESGWKDTAEPVTLSGIINIPSAGDYTVKLSNTCNGSGEAILEGITLAYAGGAVVEVPANTLEVADAIYSENGTRADGMISFPSATVTEGWAKWNINVTDEAFYKVALTIKNQYEHNMTISFYEEDGVTLVGTVSEGGNSGSAESSIGHAIDLGGIYLKVGNYVAKVTNARSGSDAKIMSVGFTYDGGAVQNMPGTTDIDEAWYSAKGTRTPGVKIDFPNSDIQNGWVKWNVAFASASNYKVTVNVNSDNCKNYTVALVDENDANVVTPLSLNDCSTKGTPVALEMGSMEVPAGNYILKVTNSTQNSDAELISVNFTYAGGGLINLPTTKAPLTLLPQDAALSSNATIVNDSIDFGGHESAYAKWNVHSNGGFYTFTVNAYNAYAGLGQRYTLNIYNSDESELVSTKVSVWNSNEGAYSFTSDQMELPTGNYVVKIQNYSGSKGRVMNIVANYLGGETIELPNVSIPLAAALLSPNAYRNDAETELHFIAPEDVEFIAAEWAKWNVHVETEGVYELTLEVVGTNHGIYTIKVDDGEGKSQGKGGSGSVTLPPVFLAQGNHVIQLANTNGFADGYLTAVSAAPAAVLVLDEMDDAITSSTGSNTPALKRTFRTGVYNSICLPFNVSEAEELTRIFGAGYELLEMTAAALDGGILTLNFATSASNIQYGRPYLIKPTKDVINPVFDAHWINNSTSHLVVSGDGANFVGVLNLQNLGTHPENLYLGTDGNLYFSNSDVTIKGFRGYFHVNVSNPQQAVKHARIVAQGQVVTSIDLVNEANEGIVKTIENGQLIIVRDGVRYNAQGQLICK